MPTSRFSTPYRGYSIKAKLDFPKGGFLVNGRKITKGYVAVKDGCNAMPGATWFKTVPEAKQAIDVLIAVGGEENSGLFWEIIQPFGMWPGDKDRDSGGSMIVGQVATDCGRFHATSECGRVVSRTAKPLAITEGQFFGLRDLLKRHPSLGMVVFSLGLTVPGTLTKGGAAAGLAVAA